MKRRRKRTAEELHQELIDRIGWAAAGRLIEAEAAILRLPVTSSTVIRNAYANHQGNSRNNPQQVQEGLPE